MLFASIAHLVSHVYLMKAMDVIGVHLMLESLALHDAGESSATSAWFLQNAAQPEAGNALLFDKEVARGANLMNGCTKGTTPPTRALL